MTRPAIPAELLRAISEAANVAAREIERQRPAVDEDLRDLFGALGILEAHALALIGRPATH